MELRSFRKIKPTEPVHFALTIFIGLPINPSPDGAPSIHALHYYTYHAVDEPVTVTSTCCRCHGDRYLSDVGGLLSHRV